jgi:hypothetical protein
LPWESEQEIDSNLINFWNAKGQWENCLRPHSGSSEPLVWHYDLTLHMKPFHFMNHFPWNHNQRECRCDLWTISKWWLYIGLWPAVITSREWN